MEPPARFASLERLRARLANREDSEHEQALIRLAFALAISLYILTVLAARPEGIGAEMGALIVAGVGASASVVAHLLWRPARSPVRRLIGMAIDVLGLSAVIGAGGVEGAAVHPILLWIVFGHGFRYGRVHLFVAAAASFAGFSVAIALSGDWRIAPELYAALAISLIALPAYVSRLLGQLEAAKARAESASAHKSRFLAAMSHEFRTPLNAILGMTDLLRSTALDREQRDMIDAARAAARNLLRLVDDVLDISRIEADRNEAPVERFSIDGLIAATRAMLHHQAAEKGLRLRARFDPRAPIHLHGAAKSLSQALVNLVANAIKYTERGGAAIELRMLEASRPDRRRLRIEVHDSGIGLDRRARVLAFEPFEQVGRTGERGGVGLGLAIAKERITAIGGSIGVVSAPGGGSTFWIEAEFEAARDEWAAPRLGGDAIVLGDPDPPLEAIVRSTGARAHSAGSLEEAISRLRAARGRRVLILAGEPSGARAEAALRAIDERLPMEPIDLIAWGRGADLRERAAAQIDPAAADAAPRLRRALAAALAPLAGDLLAERDRSGPRKARRALSILAVDDNAANRLVIGKQLARAGHAPRCVASGEAAIEAARAERFDVVLMDLDMPGMDGFSTARMLEFELDHPPPIVALTADATDATRRRALDDGFVAHLTKPIDGDRLIAEIDALFDDEEPTPAAAGDATPHRDLLDAFAIADDSSLALAEEPGGFFVPEAEPPLLDRAQLAELAALDEGDGFFADVIDAFLEEGETIVDGLVRAWAEGDVAAIRAGAHALASSGGHVGAARLIERARLWRTVELERRAREARSEISALRALWKATARALRDAKDAPPGLGAAGAAG